GRREERLEAVVVALRQRVELVIVTAGTADRQGEESFAHAVRHFCQNFLPADDRVEVAAGQVDRAAAVEAGGDEQLRLGQVGASARWGPGLPSRAAPFASRSPAICWVRKRSYGLSSLSERTT